MRLDGRIEQLGRSGHFLELFLFEGREGRLWNSVPKQRIRDPSPPSDRRGNQADIFLIGESIKTTGLNPAVHILRDGEEAMQFFDNADAEPGARCPKLIVLDMNLPKPPVWRSLSWKVMWLGSR
jgi:hypothetical protein